MASNTDKIWTCIMIGLSISGLSTGIEPVEDCRWNYILKNKDLSDAYTVEIKDLGRNCSELYENIPSSRLSRGSPYFLRVRLDHTTDPGIQRINISWNLERNIQEYLLILRLQRRENNYTLKPEDSRCIYVKIKPAEIKLQFQTQHLLHFDCIPVNTGTVGATLETILRKRQVGERECVFEQNTREICFDGKPELYASDIEADCCPKQLSPSMLKLTSEDDCVWQLSSSVFGLSGGDYVVTGSTGSVAQKDDLLLLRKHNLFFRRLALNSPDIYFISVTFWCNYNQRNYDCITIDRIVNASQCNIPSYEPSSYEPSFGENKTAPSKIHVPPRLLAAIVLGCVATIVAIVTVVFILYKRGNLPCLGGQTSSGPRNNASTQEADETLNATQHPLLVANGAPRTTHHLLMETDDNAIDK